MPVFVMPYRKVIFTDGEIYHVFNRSVNKETIFNNKKKLTGFFHYLIFISLNQILVILDIVFLINYNKHQLKN